MGLKETICLSLLVACASASYYYSCPTLFNFYPDSSDCTKFFRCVWGRPVRFSCGPGTRWNQHLLTCDHAYKVPCGSYPTSHGPNVYVPQPVQPVHNTYQPNFVHPVPNVHNVDPTYYQQEDNYNYGGDYPSGYGYHKK